VSAVEAAARASFDQVRTLRGGEQVRIRPIRPDDEPRLSELYDRLSRQTIYQRFFTVMQRLPPDWAMFLARVDYVRRFALVVEDLAAPSTRLVAVARYEPMPDEDAAELAFVVQDDWQGKGLGRLLVHELLRAAELNGIHRFRAFVLGDNRRMLRLLAHHTVVGERHVADGVVELHLTRKR
jgi:RimJ/RimL family protein N-acetyltransferase